MTLLAVLAGAAFVGLGAGVTVLGPDRMPEYTELDND